MTKREKTIVDELKGTANQIKEQVEKLIKEGNARRVIVKNEEGKILFESQLTIGVAGSAILAFSAPVLTALSAVLLYATNYRVYLERTVPLNSETTKENSGTTTAGDETAKTKESNKRKASKVDEKPAEEHRIEIQ